MRNVLMASALAALLGGCGLYQPYVSGIGSLSGEPRRGFECPGERHPSGAPYVTEGSDGSLYSFGVCPSDAGHAERKAAYVKTAPDLPAVPIQPKP